MPEDIEQAVVWVLVVIALFLAGNHLLFWNIRVLKNKRLSRILGGGAIVAAAVLGWSLTDAVYPF